MKRAIALLCLLAYAPVAFGLIWIQPSRFATAGGGGWWTSGGISSADVIAAWQPKGAAGLAASYSNLNNPGTNDATVGNAPNFNTSTGWEFVSANSDYLNTNVIPAANMTVIVRVSGIVFATVQERSAIGHLLSTTVRIGLQPTTSLGGGERSRYQNAGSYENTSNGVSSGVMCVAGQNAYEDGVSVGTTSDAWSGTATTTMLLGARRREDTMAIDLYSDLTIAAVAIYSRVLNSTEVAAVTTAMNAL